jgi:hypothetical protein
MNKLSSKPPASGWVCKLPVNAWRRERKKKRMAAGAEKRKIHLKPGGFTLSASAAAASRRKAAATASATEITAEVEALAVPAAIVTSSD